MFFKVMNIKLYAKIGLLIVATCLGFGLPTTAQANDVLSQEKLTQLVNVNTASLSDLASLKGIGQQKALAIIAYRDQQGGFNSIDELLEVKGIGDKVFANIKNKITI